MASLLVISRQKSADSVIAVGDAHAEAAGEALVALVKPKLKKGEAAPAFASVMTLACEMLGVARDRMVAKDEAHEAELSDDLPVRQQRDKVSAALYSQLVELRETLTGMFGGATASSILPGSTPGDDSLVLARFAGEVAANLTRTPLPTSRIKGAKLDAAEVAASLREQRAALEQTYKDLQREVREAQATLSAKTAAIAAYDEAFAGTATMLTGMLRLAGMPDLAAKVRPSVRRAGQTAEEAGDPAEEGGPPVT